MSLPRDLTGDRLATLLRRYGYRPVRQRGSHLRLSAPCGNGDHHITIPRHRQLRVGTLNAILWDVANFRGAYRDDIVRELFG